MAALLKKGFSLFLCFFYFAITSIGQTPTGPSYVIVHVNVIPMTSDTILKNKMVTIKNGIIMAISNSNKPPAGYKRIDGTGKYLLPALSDMHVHLYLESDLGLYLSSGIGTVMNMDGKEPAHLYWKKLATSAKLVSPDIFTCGPKFNRKFGDGAAEEVHRQAMAGYDAIKLYNNVPVEEYQSIMNAAKLNKLITVGHIPRGVGFKETLNSGQVLAHIEEFLATYFRDDFHYPIDSIKHERDITPIIDLMIANKTMVIATLVTYKQIVEQVADLNTFLKRKELSVLPEPLRDAKKADRNVYFKGFKSSQVEILQKNYELLKKIIRTLYDRGALLLSGTDAPDVGPVPGFSLLEELNEYSKLGMSNYDILKTTTVNPAIFLRQQSKFGMVVPGMDAKLILLSDNPLTSINNLSQIEGIFLKNRWLTKQKLELIKKQSINYFVVKTTELANKIDRAPDTVISYLEKNDPYSLLSAQLLITYLNLHGQSALYELLTKIKSKFPGNMLIKEGTINNLGYTLLQKKENLLAIEIFDINTKLNPSSANCFDSLAESWLSTGNKEKAILYYKKALEIDPSYPNATVARRIVAGN